MDDASKQAAASEDDVNDGADLTAMFDEANNLPADDPLHTQQNAMTPVPAASDGSDHAVSSTPTTLAEVGESKEAVGKSSHPSHFVSAAVDKVKAPQTPTENQAIARVDVPRLPVAATPKPGAPIVTDTNHRVAVPSFVGEPLRQVVENAGGAGLEVQLLGDGIAREQAPAAGTLVPLGTEIIVRFRR